MKFPSARHPFLSYGSYPLLLGGVMFAAVRATATSSTPAAKVAPLVGLVVVVCMLLEWRFPLQKRWAMTGHTFVRRDLRFLGLGLALDRGLEALVALIAAAIVPKGGFGPVSRLPIGAQAVAAVLAFDFVWYWYHRTAHRLPRLWRVHGAHHSPSQLYVLMHGVFHPLDEVVVRFVMALAVFRFGGFAPNASFLAVTFTGVIGIVSHLNFDMRIWALNHVLAGPETHRYHHSATHDGNYGAVTTIWDQVFGTFVFHAEPPERLGLRSANDYPNPERFLQVLAWPFRHDRPEHNPSAERADASTTV
jgi:sterol desaturase/sphingolipid hydroxylase (fatty acid hydroxylase superfamily)